MINRKPRYGTEYSCIYILLDARVYVVQTFQIYVLLNLLSSWNVLVATALSGSAAEIYYKERGIRVITWLTQLSKFVKAL